ncbi:GMC family oxidoreductase [Bartonella sp. HY761]|uniref:GMC family oxidoreductase n=1 Tax=Bartonella sp. HY761 TaxID=2979330 RepID=UPI0022083499|nr:GMC family oxidoreductase N-terminal domain-containing protein [Bartonella sp. HY761]UXN06592.1 GMC family oxidoreductase N-terminal domain-containing protein [Bartonella sp. HY761]
MNGNAFDYIIIGAGAAGCVVANRLSADPKYQVLLLEMGQEQKSWRTKIPAGILAMYGREQFDYRFASTPQKHLNNRRIPMNRGKGLGGSTIINSMIYIRGCAADYDHWARHDCLGWSYDDVLPIFKDLEHNLLHQDPKYHGFDGELLVDNPRDANLLSHIFVKAGNALNLPTNLDFNGNSFDGVGIYNVAQKNGQRFSAYDAYVKPCLERKNLTIWTGCNVKKLEILNKKVTSVVIKKDNIETSIEVRREAILTAGSIASPAILLASGIGPANELTQEGIEVKADIQGVGKNLQDHIDAMITVRSKSPKTLGLSMQNLPKMLAAPLQYFMQRKGMLTTNYVEAGGFAKTRYASDLGDFTDLADIQFHFVPGYRSHRGRLMEYGHGYAIHTCVLRPQSRGEIIIGRDNTELKIDINPNFLSAEQDAAVLVDGIKIARSILANSAFAPFAGNEMLPGKNVQSDDELLAYLRAEALTVYHPVGTCKMGTDRSSVVDPLSLKIHGMDNLRVADASIMPFLISGNTSAPTMMIAEKASRFICKDRTI